MKFGTRGILVHPEELTPDWLDLMKENGLNALGLHPVGGRRAAETLEAAVAAHALPHSAFLRREANKRGITVEYEAHACGWLLPRSLFSYVPDWFRMNESGERVADFNFCASSPDALDYVARRARLLASLLSSDTDRYYFWLDDVTDCACRCPACRNLSPSDQQMKILNAILKGIRSYNSNAKLSYLAYHDSLEIPRRVEPADGIFLEYAPMRRNHHVPLADPTCEENARETAPLKELLSLFGRKDAKVLEYWMDNSMFSNWTKPPKLLIPDFDVMRRDADFYESMGFSSVTGFGCYLGKDYQALYGKPPLRDYGAILNGCQRTEE